MKGELRINESIIVIFIITLLIIGGLLFYTRWYKSEFEKEKFEFERERFELLIVKIPNMAEFKCSSYGKEVECIDVSKLIAFSEINEDYSNVFWYKNITIFEIYPKDSNKVCTKSNHLNCGVYNIYYNNGDDMDNKLVISTPV